ncbi:MAG: hypothetical protein M3401_13480, partial [Actinomycetota bacterium]|nr:hypothetical protein [Actinomycetota bacterium]
SGACDELAGGDRRIALWQLGVTAPAQRVGGSRPAGRSPRSQGRREDAGGEHAVQLALALDLPTAPALQSLSAWESMVADYDTAGLTAATHPLGLLRGRLDGQHAVHVGDLARMDHEAPVRIGGLVVARQRPGTAQGVTFLLLEDEHGTVNIVVPPRIYERDRLTVRTEPLVIVEGRLERHPAASGTTNVVAREVARLDIPDRVTAEVKDFSLTAGFAGGADALELARQAELRAAATPADAGDDFRAVAPPVMSFAQGRRR